MWVNAVRGCIPARYVDESTLLYQLHVRNDNRFAEAPLVELKAVCGPGDDFAPVITISLPSEDRLTISLIIIQAFPTIRYMRCWQTDTAVCGQPMIMDSHASHPFCPLELLAITAAWKVRCSVCRHSMINCMLALH
jgi:hypothetical protein